MKSYKLLKYGHEFILCKNDSLIIVLEYANEISSLTGRNKKGVMETLNDLQCELQMPLEHKKDDFPLILINLVLYKYGMEIILN